MKGKNSSRTSDSCVVETIIRPAVIADVSGIMAIMQRYIDEA